MHHTLYITDIPPDLSAGTLRSLLAGCHLKSLILMPAVRGMVGIVEMNSPEEARAVANVLNRLKLDGDRRLTARTVEAWSDYMMDHYKKCWGEYCEGSDGM